MIHFRTFPENHRQFNTRKHGHEKEEFYSVMLEKITNELISDEHSLWQRRITLYYHLYESSLSQISREVCSSVPFWVLCDSEHRFSLSYSRWLGSRVDYWLSFLSEPLIIQKYKLRLLFGCLPCNTAKQKGVFGAILKHQDFTVSNTL